MCDGQLFYTAGIASKKIPEAWPRKEDRCVAEGREDRKGWGKG